MVNLKTETGASMSLSSVCSGRRVRFLGAQAGRGLQARLAAMGLVPGVEIEVVRSSSLGPVVIAVRGSRMVLGHGVAQKMVVG